MLVTLIYLSLLLQSGLAVVVQQSGDQVSRPGDKVMLECSLGQGFIMTSYTMYWYRQNHYAAQVEFLTKEHDQSEGRLQSTIAASKNNFSLQITDLLLTDSSTYYCAASHSDAHGPGSHTNTKSDCSIQHAGRRKLWHVWFVENE
ncbi:unnamed protein product [Pleuronectes platessa]|uniref:Ig-like domain-containing protein n=1 Tax=Pleuronectes platessa TaxID=8262 RepID=A0A9N7VIJ1_PLEPL|nr:unnamed protein product [Pleuronectes platessa]